MKVILFFWVFAIVGSVNAQSLKDALYGGKLKTDTGTVVKKGDSLRLREDIPPKVKKDSLKKEPLLIDTANKKVPDTASIAPIITPPADNNKVWKQFVDEYTTIIKTEVLPSRKIKQGAYYVLIEYEIGPDGTVSTINISCSPQNSYLVEQIKERMMSNAPQLTPLLSGNGKLRKSLKKQMMTFIKEK